MDREQIARKLFEGIPDALVVADRKGIIRVWNGGAERIFGFSEGEALGQSLDIITPERLRERHWNGYEATMRTGQTKYGAGDLLSVPAVRKDGAQISIQFSIVPLRGEDGDLQAVAAIMRDVTEDFEERKRLRRALRG
ncbi:MULTISPECIES: PAS domain-containing protein [Roseobacteraceae]|uniref:PAS domain S-box-containing protein n=1 Tax=Alloyangia pacifica TaxID=311180 RepID=A0A1I6WJ09_9RHOB|nr:MULTISPECIES: PAS domain S-box protein [Roseobacteraceae]NDW34227.1 PAS domain S-box protein [Salipiger sp. PrR007]SDI82054.1 PAS domain S-box-containing protein [Alloyangia pacifica]SFT25980.1 PAS domain S-box-containing protein [Alloyangia pacifica]